MRSPDYWDEAKAHLCAVDPVIGAVIARLEEPPLQFFHYPLVRLKFGSLPQLNLRPQPLALELISSLDAQLIPALAGEGVEQPGWALGRRQRPTNMNRLVLGRYFFVYEPSSSNFFP